MCIFNFRKNSTRSRASPSSFFRSFRVFRRATWHQFQERAVIFCSIDPQGQKASNLAVPHGLRGGRHGQIVLPGE